MSRLLSVGVRRKEEGKEKEHQISLSSSSQRNKQPSSAEKAVLMVENPCETYARSKDRNTNSQVLNAFCASPRFWKTTVATPLCFPFLS